MSLDNFIDIKKKNKFVDDKKLEFSFKDYNFKKEEVERYLPWFLKYQPKIINDLILTPEVEEVINFVKNFNKNKGKALLLFGPPGCGKTTTVNIVAKSFDYEILEVNASDTRNKKSINELLGNSIKQKSLFAKSKLILIDEVDGVAGREDRGGISEIVKVIKNSPYPIILTANNVEDVKLKPLKKVSKFINFEKNNRDFLIKLSKKILESENIRYKEEDLLTFVSNRNVSDIRGFINDLQASFLSNQFDISLYEERDYKKIIEVVLNNIVKLNPKDAFYNNLNTDINLDDLFLYLEENVPPVANKKNLYLIFNEISKADVYRGRIIRWQYWRFLVYINFYLNFGVSCFLNVSKIPAKKNRRILQKWIYNNKYSILKERTKIQKSKNEEPKIIEKISNLYHCSVKKTKKEILPYFLFTFKNNADFRENIIKKLNLDENEVRNLLLLEL